jgi:hypothetical protein
MKDNNRISGLSICNGWTRSVSAIIALVSLSVGPSVYAEERAEFAELTGQPAELSAWAYAFRADTPVQEKPEACFVLRRLERLDRVYRPVSALLSDGNSKKGMPWPSQEGDWQLLPKETVWKNGALLPPPRGELKSALLWEGRMHLKRLELHWPKGQTPRRENVELRVYPSLYGWFGWQSDERVLVEPEISVDGSTWTYRGDWDRVDMTAVFVRGGETKKSVPRILAYGPEVWKRIDVQIEWGVGAGMQQADYSGRVEGFLGVPGEVAPLKGDVSTIVDSHSRWRSHGDTSQRGIVLPLLYIQPAEESLRNMPKYPYGHPRDTRMTVWTKAGNFTFLVRDLKKGPILAPEYGFFVTKVGGKNARQFAAEIAGAGTRSIRELTRAHREATWEEAMREIKLPLLPQGTKLPPYKQVADPPMQVELSDRRWNDAWRMGASHLKNGELTYMNLALEAPRPIHAMDAVGLHDTASKCLDGFLQRPGAVADGGFHDGSGNFCIGKLFRGTAITNCPGHDTYELVHNGGTGRILYDLAEHYFLTGDKAWFQKNQRRMQAAADWIVRQRSSYMNDVPNRNDLWVAGLQPPQHIADCAWGGSEWKWYVNIDGWYCQGLRRFADAMREISPEDAQAYLDEAEQYRKALQKAIERAIALAPVMRVRNGTYRSYIPPIFYIRGPSIGQVVQIAMTDDDWPLEMVDSVGVPDANDPRLDGHLDVVEDTLMLQPTHLFSGNRFQFLAAKRREGGLSKEDDWFWGGASPQLGYSYLANVYLRRDEIPSYLRQFVNNYASFVMPTPEYCFLEHFMNHVDGRQMEAFQKGDYRGFLNGHALSYFMEQFRSLLVWEDGNALWLAKATPRHWLEQGKKISVRNAPTYFGTVAYRIVSDTAHGKIAATVEMPTRNPPKTVLLRLRHPSAALIRSVTVNGAAWTDFNPAKEVISLHGVKGTVEVESRY